MSRFQELLPEFEAAGAQVLGISVDSAFANNAFAESLGVTFPVLGDFPWAPTARAWKVINEERGIANRSTFVTDRDGVVRHIIQDARDPVRHADESLGEIQKMAGG